MNPRISRCPLLAFAAVAALLSLLGCGHSVRVRYQDELVKITEHSTINFVNVHASSETEVLSIWGRDFKDVRGFNPCYLTLTNRHLILFVTGRTFDGGQAVVHLADTLTHEIRSFPAHDSQIGRNIGAAETNRFERVMSLNGDKLVLEAAFPAPHYKRFIDLAEPRFEREEVDFEGLGHKLEHHVYENGRSE